MYMYLMNVHACNRFLNIKMITGDSSGVQVYDYTCTCTCTTVLKTSHGSINLKDRRGGRREGGGRICSNQEGNNFPFPSSTL